MRLERITNRGKTVALADKNTDNLSMPRGNQRTGKRTTEDEHVLEKGCFSSQEVTEAQRQESQWPGKTGASSAFPEDCHERWYPTGWGAGCGPDLSASPTQSATDSPLEKSELKSKAPSFVIGSICPNCGFAKLSLDADEYVSCPLCRFGGICNTCR